jgi:Tol biopolymer transport system component
MRLEPGATVGRYRISKPLGSGGMGEVYRATDPVLNREVALKIIRSDREGEYDRRRFEHEAQAASALNHPHVASVFDFGTQNGSAYLVSELVEGRSLRDLLRRGGLPYAEVLAIAEQIASALAAAHQAGIVHRDLKPENIIVGASGYTKIVDFGIAKRYEPTAGDGTDGTATMLTPAGVIVGTTAYMSPEQIRGSDVDFRSDQFSFGVVLLEMLTGESPFSRPTLPDTMSAILHDKPIHRQLTLPELFRWVLDRCLNKDPKLRYASTSDLHLELAHLRDHLQDATGDPVAPSPGQARRVSSLLVAAATLIALAASAVVWRAWTSRGVDAAAFRFVPLALEAGYESYPAWSPDGKIVAYTAEVDGIAQVFKRSIDSVVPDRLTNEAADCSVPFWTPDGTRIYFVRDTALWRIGAGGGQPELVHSNVQRASISPDGGTLALTRADSAGQGGLWLASPASGPPRRYTAAPFSNRTFIIADVQFSPDGKNIGLSMISGQQPPEFWVIPFPSGTPKQLQFLSNLARWHPFSWMPDSRHAVVGIEVTIGSRSQLWMADTVRDKIQPVSISTASFTDPAVSPDGRMLAVTVDESEQDVIEIQIDGGRIRPAVATSAREHSPVWLPTGEGFVYVTDRTGEQEIWIRRRGIDSPLVTERNFPAGRTYYLSTPQISHDGQRVAFTRRVRGGTTSIWIAPVSGGAAVRLLNSERPQRAPTWSPDDNWIAYLSASGGADTLLKRRIGASGESEILKSALHLSGEPRWSPDGQWVLYGNRGEMRVVSADGKVDRLLSRNNWLSRVWSKDGKLIYGVRFIDRRYSIMAFDTRTNSERELFKLGTSSEPVRLGSPRLIASGDIALHPHGRSLLATLAKSKGDIWLLEGFWQRAGIFQTAWRDRVPD